MLRHDAKLQVTTLHTHRYCKLFAVFKCWSVEVKGSARVWKWQAQTELESKSGWVVNAVERNDFFMQRDILQTQTGIAMTGVGSILTNFSWFLEIFISITAPLLLFTQNPRSQQQCTNWACTCYLCCLMFQSAAFENCQTIGINTLVILYHLGHDLHQFVFQNLAVVQSLK